MLDTRSYFRVIKAVKVIDSKEINKESLKALKFILLERLLKGSVMVDSVRKNSIH